MPNSIGVIPLVVESVVALPKPSCLIVDLQEAEQALHLIKFDLFFQVRRHDLGPTVLAWKCVGVLEVEIDSTRVVAVDDTVVAHVVSPADHVCDVPVLQPMG